MAVKATIVPNAGFQTNLAPNATAMSGTKLLVIAGLGVGAYLLYKHMKKGSTVELSGTDAVDVDDDGGHDDHDDGED